MTTWVDFAEVRRRVKIDEVLLKMYGLGDTLKRRGNRLVGPCPIHPGADSPRAFHVDVEKGVYFCFSGCGGKGGNVIDLVSAIDRTTVREAALKLQAAFLNGGETSPPTGTQRSPNAAPPAPVPVAPDASTAATKPPAAEEEGNAPSALPNPPLALRLSLAHDHPYIAQRGLSLDTATTFGLGYCRRGMLRGMVALPVANSEDEIVGYVGRRLKPQDIEAFGKYRFPKNFRSDLLLFNLPRAVKNREEKSLIVVEGFFGAMMLHQLGFRNVVATMDCSLSETQALLLAAHASSVTLVFDGGTAGRAGTKAALELLSGKVRTRAIWLPDAAQPDTLPSRLVRWALRGATELDLSELSFSLATPSASQAT